MSDHIKLNDLSDLQQLLPESERHADEPQPGHDGKDKSVHVALDRRGRKGKTVTVISGFQHNPETMEALAKTFKQLCGAGGTVRGMSIEIQGDQRIRIVEKLREMKYVVK